MKKLILATLVGVGCQVYAAPKVVTTIKPVQSLAAQVMDGIAEPELIIKQGSPHGYQMKPSDATSIAEADLVIYVSHELETFIPALLEKSKKEHSIEWEAIPNVNPLLTRHGGMWEEGDEHHHHDHDHDAHDHDHHDHDHDHHGHHHGKYDAHLWLSVERSKILLGQIAQELSEIDPDNAAKYQANAEKSKEKLDTLQKDLAAKLQPVQQRPFMVFHDAYQYFEKDYGLNAVGTVRVDPEHEPGAKRIGELHETIKDNKVVCLFSEPQFPAKIVTKLAKETKVKTAVLDPVGADLAVGKDMYAQLLGNLANNLETCLKP
ncbi:MAG: zinc ABC transporter substrate-binding protein ZnuA [Cardiobacteriaceae bacterium]|nr:zinc ABC transporter substrate-binding protein ZnuA [Cardiobacteriaceae bacterium]